MAVASVVTAAGVVTGTGTVTVGGGAAGRVVVGAGVVTAGSVPVAVVSGSVESGAFPLAPPLPPVPPLKTVVAVVVPVTGSLEVGDGVVVVTGPPDAWSGARTVVAVGSEDPAALGTDEVVSPLVQIVVALPPPVPVSRFELFPDAPVVKLAVVLGSATEAGTAASLAT